MIQVQIGRVGLVRSWQRLSLPLFFAPARLHFHAAGGSRFSIMVKMGRCLRTNGADRPGRQDRLRYGQQEAVRGRIEAGRSRQLGKAGGPDNQMQRGCGILVKAASWNQSCGRRRAIQWGAQVLNSSKRARPAAKATVMSLLLLFLPDRLRI